jgi:hypothetical protein
MFTGGAEVVTLGKMLSQTAKMVSPVVTGGPASRIRRAQLYSDFQRASLETLAWAESITPLQQSAPTRWAVPLLTTTAITTSLFGSSEHRRSAAVGMLPVSALLLAHQLALDFDYQHAARQQGSVISAQSAQLLARLAEMRLLAGPQPLRAAEQVTAVIGELLASIPVRKDKLLRRSAPSTDRFVACRNAMAYQLRQFTNEARTDLEMLPWRKRMRQRWWQVYRPKPIDAVEIDIERLIAPSSSGSPAAASTSDR